MNCTLNRNLRLFFDTIGRRSVALCAILLMVFGLGLSLTSGVVQAGICFLPDCQDKQKTEADNSGVEECRDKGYESDQNRICPVYSIIEYCPENTSYIKCDEIGWCNLNDYTETTCEAPKKLFNKCPNSQEMYKECKLDDEEACKLENPSYVSICQAGWTLDPDKLCSLSPYYGLCCNMCPGYNYTASTIPEGATPVASCDSCDGKKFIIADEGFNQCKGFWDCQDGCEIGSETCVSGGVTKCKTCKRCEAKCSNLTCPPGALCQYEACTQRYCNPTGCAVGYTYLCNVPETQNCAELGYNTSAATCDGMGQVVCPYDTSKVYCIPDNGDCCNVLCTGYDYKYEDIPVGYTQTGSCHCCGKDRFKITKNSCAGFVNIETCKYGVAAGVQTCQSGDLTLYKECKVCPNATEHWICPDGAICTKDACSNTYTPTGCATNNQNYCTTPNTNCESLGYTMISAECASAKTILKCPYDANKVFCDPQENVSCDYYCNEYTYLSIPSGYVEKAQKTCCGKTYFQVKDNPCSGFNYSNEDCEFGGDMALGTCLSGTTTMYKSCKACANICDEACPDGAICTLDACSKTYCPNGCATNYKYFCGTTGTDCDKLGYRSVNAECASGQVILKCPYNQNLVYCN